MTTRGILNVTLPLNNGFDCNQAKHQSLRDRPIKLQSVYFLSSRQLCLSVRAQEKSFSSSFSTAAELLLSFEGECFATSVSHKTNEMLGMLHTHNDAHTHTHTQRCLPSLHVYLQF